MKKTEHFKNCLGVFQGGGCKALAFAGAFKEASERGVFFSEVAGTSAGSIIAALVAAGATPDYIEEAIKKTDFSKFKQSAEGTCRKKHFLFRFSKFLKYIPIKKIQLYRNIIEGIGELGLFSSSEIENWIEQRLKELLNVTNIVRFKDLHLPLHVIATELGVSSPKVWSLNATPDDSVAYAVRCSCTIPLFFQPVENKFVDGGIVSNLPSFALSKNNNHSYENILCFTLSSEDQKSIRGNNNLTLKGYLLQLISATIDGAVNIQNGLQKNLYFVKIGNLPLGTIDFNLVNYESLQKMFSAGKEATSCFFNAEIANINNENSDRLLLATEPEALNQIVREDCQANDQVFFAFNNTRYVYTIFPTIFYWIRKGVKLTFYTMKAKDKDEHEKFRHLLLKNMGVRIFITENLPFQGVLFKIPVNSGSAVILNKSKDSFATKYNGVYDDVAIRLMLEELEKLKSTDSIEPSCIAL
jgi:predicted acylesterase/phospholipase RssA